MKRIYASRFFIISAVLAFSFAAVSCKKKAKVAGGEKVLVIGQRAVAGSVDPNNPGSMYDLDLLGLVYDTLYEYDYSVRPYKVKPAMAAGMPEISQNGLTYTIKLKPGQYYIDDKCFEATGGQGREAVAKDFIMNLYRKADISTKSQNWWLVSGRIEGLDDLRKKYTGKKFDYDVEIPGLQAPDDHTIVMKLTKPFPQIMWILAIQGMTLYPLECAQYYGKDFDNHPVGTGPFRLVEWQKNAKYVVVRNEKYREDIYEGKRLPLADKVIVHEFSQDQPYWLQFRADKIAWAQVPAEFTEVVFKIKSRDGNKRVWEIGADGKRVLTETFSKYAYVPHPLIDFIYRGFNYEDALLGGEKGKKLRQALSLAYDPHEANDLFYNGLNIVYSGIIPPRLAGHDPDVANPYRGPNFKKAKQLLAEAGYPGGKGLPEIQLCGSESTRTQAIAAQFIRGAKKIGVNIRLEATRFAELSKKLKEKRCQMMGLAWGGDWPDAQNFIQLMYGPNASPGSNTTNFNHPEVNKLYEKASVMQDSPERTRLYQVINKIVIENVPFMGAQARTRDYLINPDTQGYIPEEMFHQHAKFVSLKSWGE